LVTFFEVITFFGVAAFFAWLEFLTLLNDLASELESRLRQQERVSSPTVRSNLVAISDYFLASFVFYGTAVVADYLYHNAVRFGPYDIASFYHSIWLMFIVVVSFVAGTIVFLRPIGYIRSILRGDRNLLSEPFGVLGTLIVSYMIAASLGLDWSLYVVVLRNQYGLVVFLLAGALTFVGAWRIARPLAKPLVGLLLLLSPLWLWIPVFLFLHFWNGL
jgi:hypothetical protein